MIFANNLYIFYKSFTSLDFASLKRFQNNSKKTWKQFQELFHLVCIRYRCDDKQNKKIKTVELIVESKTWYSKQKWSPPNKIMYLRIQYGEIRLAKLVKEAGGKWNREKRAWEFSLGEVIALGLENRIIKDYL